MLKVAYHITVVFAFSDENRNFENAHVCTQHGNITHKNETNKETNKQPA